jgi:FAD synthase
MSLTFSSHSISGFSIGKQIGFPTINLKIPPRFTIKEGVYSCEVSIGRMRYEGILYFGPCFVQNNKQGFVKVKSGDNVWKTLEIHLIKKNSKAIQPIPPHKKIVFKIGKFMRPPQKITSLSLLKKLIQSDVNKLTRSEC